MVNYILYLFGSNLLYTLASKLRKEFNFFAEIAITFEHINHDLILCCQLGMGLILDNTFYSPTFEGSSCRYSKQVDKHKKKAAFVW